MSAPGNAYPAVQLDSRGQVVDSGVVVQFTDSTDQPGAGGGSTPGTLIGQPATTQAFADNGTTVTCDGSTQQVPCLIAAPPSWMDDAGNITAPGLYLINCSISPGVAPTTPGLFASWFVGNEITLFPLDPLATLTAIPATTVGVAVTDLPFPVAASVNTPTDVTATLSCLPSVTQLASATT